jgi:hypothetical protein
MLRISAMPLLEQRDVAALPLLLDRAEHLVRSFAPDTDLLEEVVQRLVMTVRRITPPEMVGTIVLPLLAGAWDVIRAATLDALTAVIRH